MVITEEVKEAARKQLRTYLTKVQRPSGSIRIMPDERVPPGAGEEFFGIYGASQSLLTAPHDVTKSYSVGFQIALTRRVLAIPNEQAGEAALTYNEAKIGRSKPSVIARMNEITEVLNRNDGWTLISAINSVILPKTGGCFIEPFALVSFSAEPEQVREEHFDVQPENTGLARDVRYAGLLVRLEFAGGKYTRPSRPA